MNRLSGGPNQRRIPDGLRELAGSLVVIECTAVVLIDVDHILASAAKAFHHTCCCQ